MLLKTTSTPQPNVAFSQLLITCLPCVSFSVITLQSDLSLQWGVRFSSSLSNSKTTYAGELSVEKNIGFPVTQRAWLSKRCHQKTPINPIIKKEKDTLYSVQSETELQIVMSAACIVYKTTLYASFLHTCCQKLLFWSNQWCKHGLTCWQRTSDTTGFVRFQLQKVLWHPLSHMQ